MLPETAIRRAIVSGLSSVAKARPNSKRLVRLALRDYRQCIFNSPSELIAVYRYRVEGVDLLQKGTTVKQFAKMLGRSDSFAYKRLRALVDCGEVAVDTKQAPFIYTKKAEEKK